MEYYEWKNKVSLEHSEEIKEEINKLNSIYNELNLINILYNDYASTYAIATSDRVIVGVKQEEFGKQDENDADFNHNKIKILFKSVVSAINKTMALNKAKKSLISFSGLKKDLGEIFVDLEGGKSLDLFKNNVEIKSLALKFLRLTKLNITISYCKNLSLFLEDLMDNNSIKYYETTGKDYVASIINYNDE
ncbi:Hypothetical protein SRAE_0000055700 [Strongyloides ratti]|uniref:Uncharacterized protein n=1 Tax=Strongyloides ratti TaxID=34506 RepID=A0A090MSZ1_STRRB|nr:Hypothetical protein SRAE_0000055700 [Strongyloides ratti]CEF61433.1 Hypothetical protein SRAE_0000055700 [Strongyloides ratti]